jgi:hypothetical protein
MFWKGMAVNALGHVIVPVFTATHLNHFASQRITFTEAVFGVHNLNKVHVIIQHPDHSGATIKYSAQYLEEFQGQKNVFSQCVIS